MNNNYGERQTCSNCGKTHGEFECEHKKLPEQQEGQELLPCPFCDHLPKHVGVFVRGSSVYTNCEKCMQTTQIGIINSPKPDSVVISRECAEFCSRELHNTCDGAHHQPRRAGKTYRLKMLSDLKSAIEE